MMLFGRPTSVPRGYARPVVVDRVIVWGVEPVFLLETVRLSNSPPLMSQRGSPQPIIRRSASTVSIARRAFCCMSALASPLTYVFHPEDMTEYTADSTM